MNIRCFSGPWVCLIVAFSFAADKGVSQINSNQHEQEPIGYLNWPTRTLGGLQFWSDVRYVGGGKIGGWKIQRNSNTGHHRLLNPVGVRYAWGNLAHCDQELHALMAAGKAKPCKGKVVIVLHGLMRTSNAMHSLAEYLRQRGGYTVVNFQYASSRETVDVHARDLRNLIEGLGNEVTEINFVGHSLGNLVVRHYLGDAVRSGTSRDPRIARMVMLGPPNQGSQMARVLKNSFLFKTIAGASGAQISIGWEHLQPKLAIPDFKFGIIAGGQAEESDLSNFMLNGKDDFTVSLEETKLAGAHDLFVKPFLHSTIMNQKEVHEATLSFLKHGYFVSEEDRQPIPNTWKKATPSKVNQGSQR